MLGDELCAEMMREHRTEVSEAERKNEHIVSFDNVTITASRADMMMVLSQLCAAGLVHEEIVRGRDCARFNRCPMRKGDGSCFCWQGRRREDA